MPSALGRGISQALDNLDYSQEIPLTTDIPLDPHQFYTSFGYLSHPVTRKPVTQLADYQLDSWRKFLKHGRILEVKSHRIGESSKWMLVNFQLAILPTSNPLSTRGFDTMLLGATKPQAVEILRDFRRRALASTRYSPYILDKPEEIDEYGDKAVLRDEKSKTAALFIKNPEDPLRPSRIIAFGADNPGALESWPNFKHLHITDIVASRRNYKDSLEIALTRIANTNGTVIIETVPGHPVGPVYEWSQRYRGIPEDQLQKGDFLFIEITADQAVAAGVMPKDFLEGERRRLTTADFNALYGAQFGGTTGNVFSSQAIENAIKLGIEWQEKYGLEPSSDADKSQGIDPGFGSSMFGEVVVQLRHGKLQVLLAEESERPDLSQKALDAERRVRQWKIGTTQVDGNNPEFITALKRRLGEAPNYEDVPEEKHKWMKVKPIGFNKYGRQMLSNDVMLMEKGYLAISPKFDKLVTALRTAIAEDGKLDKESTLYNDILDAFSLALHPYYHESKRR